MLWELGHWVLCREVSRTCWMWLEVGSWGKSTADAKYNRPVYLAKMWKRLMLISPSVKTEVFLHSFKHQKLRKSCLRVSSRCTCCSLSLSYLDILFQVCSHPQTSLCVKTWIFGVVVSNDASKGIFFKPGRRGFKTTSVPCCCWVAKSCLTLYNPMDCSPPVFPVPISRGLLRFLFIELVIVSYHLIFHWHLLLLPSVFPSIRVFSMIQLFASVTF